jgi:hypothetical protein
MRPILVRNLSDVGNSRPTISLIMIFICLLTCAAEPRKQAKHRRPEKRRRAFRGGTKGISQSEHTQRVGQRVRCATGEM